MQDGNFYRDNLRTARAEFVYISDGMSRTVRPHFTYYGFRYVKLAGFTAAILPWDMYCYYGDETIMAEQYDSMKQWVEHIHAIDAATGDRRRWDVGFHFGGWLAITTQTAYALALSMAFAPEGSKPRLAELLEKLKAKNGHLQTGFVGTAILNQALSDHGGNEMAYKLLLNEDYPS